MAHGAWVQPAPEGRVARYTTKYHLTSQHYRFLPVGSIRPIAEPIPTPAIVAVLEAGSQRLDSSASICFELTRDKGDIEHTTPGAVMGIPMSLSTPDEPIEDLNQAIG